MALGIPAQLPALAAACLFCTLFLASQGRSALPPAGVLTDDLTQWSLIPGFLNRSRIWSRADLEPAYARMGSAYHAMRLLRKLHSGQGVVVVAMGSSFVHDFAGCWHTTLQAVHDLGIVPNPHLYVQPGQEVGNKTAAHVHLKCQSGGYMEAFMEVRT